MIGLCLTSPLALAALPGAGAGPLGCRSTNNGNETSQCIIEVRSSTRVSTYHWKKPRCFESKVLKFTDVWIRYLDVHLNTDMINI